MLVLGVTPFQAETRLVALQFARLTQSLVSINSLPHIGWAPNAQDYEHLLDWLRLNQAKSISQSQVNFGTICPNHGYRLLEQCEAFKLVCVLLNSEHQKRYEDLFSESRGAHNHWTIPSSENRHTNCLLESRRFPKYGLEVNKSISTYLQEYDLICKRLAVDFPDRVHLCTTNEISSETGASKLLFELGIELASRDANQTSEMVGESEITYRNIPKKPNSDSIIIVPYRDVIPEYCERILRHLELSGHLVQRSEIRDDTLRLDQLVFNAVQAGYKNLILVSPEVEFDPRVIQDLLEGESDIVFSPTFDRHGRPSMVADDTTSSICFGQSGDKIRAIPKSLGIIRIRRCVFEAIAYNDQFPLVAQEGQLAIPFFQPRVLSRNHLYGVCSGVTSFCDAAKKQGFTVLADCRNRVWCRSKYAYSWENSGASPTYHDTYRLDP
jgi:hypothetical protein